MRSRQIDSDTISKILRLEQEVIAIARSGLTRIGGKDSCVVQSSDIWSELESLSGNTWVQSFPIRSLIFQQRFSSATSKDFALEQLNLCDLITNQVILVKPIQKSVYYHMKRYRGFLETVCIDQLEEQGSSDGDKGLAKVPFLIKSNEVAVLMTLMKDCGFIAPVTDYKLGKIIEQTCLYDCEKSMKGARKVISKHRCLELNTEETLQCLKQQLSEGSINLSKYL